MSNAPYQLRTTYLDGSVTRDMINNQFDDPRQTLDTYIMRHPAFFAEVARVDLLNLDNQILGSHEFKVPSRRAA